MAGICRRRLQLVLEDERLVRLSYEQRDYTLQHVQLWKRWSRSATNAAQVDRGKFMLHSTVKYC